MLPCHNDRTHPGYKYLYFVTQYENWPVAHYPFCKECYTWGLKHRPDLYFLTEEAAQAESVSRNLLRGTTIM